MTTIYRSAHRPALCAAVAAAAFAVACERPGSTLVPPQSIVVEGCLTAADGQFVITELAEGAPGPRVAEQQGDPPWARAQSTTDAYRLMGADEELRALVGQRVEIAGEASTARVVDVRGSSPPAASAGDAVGTSGDEPQVSTMRRARIAISELQVGSVTATGERCRVAG